MLFDYSLFLSATTTTNGHKIYVMMILSMNGIECINSLMSLFRGCILLHNHFLTILSTSRQMKFENSLEPPIPSQHPSHFHWNSESFRAVCNDDDCVEVNSFASSRLFVSTLTAAEKCNSIFFSFHYCKNPTQSSNVVHALHRRSSVALLSSASRRSTISLTLASSVRFGISAITRKPDTGRPITEREWFNLSFDLVFILNLGAFALNLSDASCRW